WDEQEVQVQVVDQMSDQPPQITSTPVTTAVVGRPFAYDALGMDPDNDPLIWSLTVKPFGMSIDPGSGAIRWTPTSEDLGDVPVTVRLMDVYGAVDFQSFKVTVRGISQPPYISSSPRTQ